MKIEPVKITADSPEQFREALIEFLTGLSVGYRVRMDAVQTKKLKIVYEAKAQAIEDIVAQIRVFEIIKHKPIPSNYLGNYVETKSVDDWIKEDRFIYAIKRRRVDTGESLLEAKNYVEKRKIELTTNKDL